ncbi:MAG: ABC transporter permease [Planctomycetota bacterium]
MFSYVTRRLLIMIPTVVGITFLVFMLIALSPGGIGASLRQAGGQMEASQRALQEAYLEDRYGLNDPPPVQFLRWAARISPIKFGDRDLRDDSGLLIRPPKDVKLPPLAGVWYADDVTREDDPPRLPPAELGGTQAEQRLAYRQRSQAYARARGQFVEARLALEEALVAFATTVGLDAAIDNNEKPVIKAFRRIAPGTPRFNELVAADERALAASEAVVDAGNAAMEARSRAVEAQRELRAAFDAQPYEQVGIPIVPGVHLSAPDLGESFSRRRPVSDLIGEALPVTLMLNLIAFPIIYIVAVPCGMLAAVRRGSWFDVLSGLLFIGLWSLPRVSAGILLLGYAASDDGLGWFPVKGLHAPDADTFTFLPHQVDGQWQRGYLLDTLWHAALPVLCLVYFGFAVLSKQTRAAMLENFTADYVRTAKAKGVAPNDVTTRHVFRNSLLPLITIFATIFPTMLSGSVVIERIFSVPGMGNLLIEAIALRDRELLLANVLMISIVNLLALLLADILYALADPRVSYE